MQRWRWWQWLGVATLAACSSPTPAPSDAGADVAATGDADVPAVTDAPRPADGGIESVPLAETRRLPGLTRAVEVLRTEGGVPHVYAHNEDDLYRTLGFVVARDRYFMIDLARRLAQGKVSALLGDAALSTDLESRGTGMLHVTEGLLGALSPETARRFDAYAAGINAYIAAVRAGEAPPPSELQVAAPLLGRPNAGAMMEDFTRRDICAMGTTFLYQSGFETEDVGRTASAAALPGDFTGQALARLRRAGTLSDIWNRGFQARPSASARGGWGLETGTMPTGLTPPVPGQEAPPAEPVAPARPPRTDSTFARRVPASMLADLDATLRRIQDRLNRPRFEGFGSNAWAVMGRHTRDGATLLAADGHLPLTIPTLFYQVGLNTRHLGGGDIQQVGIMLPLVPALAMGTNGHVAWGHTQLAGDITDWYREEVLLDAQGRPRATRFMGQERPLQRIDEAYVIANVPALNSRGRTERVTRWVTFDGRFLTAIEGRRPMAGETLPMGQSRVTMLGEDIVPGDTNNDGVITGVSFDYVPLDPSQIFDVVDRWGKARDVAAYRQASRGLVGYSLNQVAADAQGSIYYAGYQAVPCRGYLPRDSERNWLPGADPRQLLDGTRYGGFRIPVRDGVVDEAPGQSDPYQCVVPFERTPAALNPDRGYVQTANNEPGEITGDGSVTNDPYYIGGPWGDGFRAYRLDQTLSAGVTARSFDEETTAQLQGDVHSNLGEVFVPVLLDAVSEARTAAMGTPAAGSVAARLAAMYRANRADYDEVARRLAAWRDADYRGDSGVETFYHALTPGEGERSVATTLFNAWMGRFVREVFDDERLPAGVFDGGGAARIRTLMLMLESRGENRRMLASFNPETRESAYFDILGTEAVETSREVALRALDLSLTYLRSAPRGPGVGGFGTRDWDAFRWGLRHHVRFNSILASFLGNNASFGALTDGFSITPARIPLAPNLGMDDPRRTLPGFPRPGDQWVVDAANSGLNGETFTFGSGPTYRMVVALRPGGPDATTGRNIVPGGQSGLRTSPHFDDQVRLWLGNRALPMPLATQAVINAAQSRERFEPAP